jgi:hypothetical protein
MIARAQLTLGRPGLTPAFALALGGVAVLAGCASSTPPPSRATLTSAEVSPSSMPVLVSRENLPLKTGRAHGLVIVTASCWLGGLWSDALAEDGAARAAGIRERCDGVREAVRQTVGEPVLADAPLRAVDATAVDRIADAVLRMAKDDAVDRPHAAELASLLRAVARASRETVDARRAADDVKMPPPSSSPDARRAAKIVAAMKLRSSLGVRGLLRYPGPYAAEAEAIALLHAMDRMEIAHGLPKHLKVYAVEGVFDEIFGVKAPELGPDPSAPIPSGTWLAYMTSVASAANHPVPASAKDPQNREPFAWNGTLEGLTDRLRNLRGPLDERLDVVVRNVVDRIGRQAASQRMAFEAHWPSDR